MGILVAAYIVVWLGLGSYVIWLGAQQRRLAHEVQALEMQLASLNGPQMPRATAA
jgi:CcmD family protein